MKGINKVILLGIVGGDPEIKYTQNGKCVAMFSLATNSKFRDKRTDEQVQKTSWHYCVAFGKTAELIEQFMRKGSKTYLEGAIDYQQYETDAGEKKYITKITVKDFVLLNSVDGDENKAREQYNPKQPIPKHKNQKFEDDEIPF